MEKAELSELLKIRNVCHALSSRYKETTEEIRLLTEDSDDDIDFYSVRDSINSLLDITSLMYESVDRFKDYLKNHIIEGELVCSTVHTMEYDILNPKVRDTLEKNYTMFKDILTNLQDKMNDGDECDDYLDDSFE